MIRPIARDPGLYVRSSAVTSTCTLPRGLASKLYHSSLRVHRSGRLAVDGCFLSATMAVPWSTPGCSGMWAPPLMVWSHHGYSLSMPMSVALWMATMPLPLAR